MAVVSNDRNIAENLNRLSRAHERYRRQTDGRSHIANVNVNSRSLKSMLFKFLGDGSVVTRLDENCGEFTAPIHGHIVLKKRRNNRPFSLSK